MDITALSTAQSQQNVKMEAGMSVQKMVMDTSKTQGAELIDMMKSAQVITDPALGNTIDLLA